MRAAAPHRTLPLVGAIAVALLAGAAGALAQDADADGVPDERDDCVDVANPAQRDDDFDRFGNACDGDLNQDGVADDADRALLVGEVDSPTPRLVADFDGDGVVDDDDVAFFDAALAGRAPGPAGPLAHDEDGDGLLDHCRRTAYDACLATCPDDFASCHAACDPTGAPFRHRRDPTLQPNLLANPGLDTPPPAGWDAPNPTYVGWANEVGRDAPGAFQWLAWGGAGRGNATECRSSCITPEPIPVEPGRTYAFSFFSCVPGFPPALLTFDLLELDGAGVGLDSASAINGSKLLPSQPGRWEETVFYYRPVRPETRFVRPRLYRKGGATSGRGTVWADDFAFWELDDVPTRTRRMPPAAKRAFDGARTRVDALGNFEVFDDGAWTPFFPVGIYADWRRDFAAYSSVGFNLVMNERGFGVEAGPGIDAVSELNPGGMRFLFIANGWNDVGEGELQLDQALTNLRTRTSSERGVRLWDRMLGFNYDNEVFSRCGRTDPDTGACVERMWTAQEEPLARMREVDREENGGVRGVPFYFLHGNPHVARAYAGEHSTLASGDDQPRCDVTGTYGAADLVELSHSQGQLAPVTTAQIQTHVGALHRPVAWGGIALGARMIGTWRDWSPARSTYGQLYKAPVLQACGTSDFGLATRENYFAPQGGIVRGADSGALVELLDGPHPHTCSTGGTGVGYEVHLRGGALAPGEALIDDATGLPIAGTTVDRVTGSVLVDYEIGVTDRSWYATIDELRREIDALMPVVRAGPAREWHATFRATGTDGTRVPAGDDGLLAGARDGAEGLHLILANAHHRLDAAAPWDEQRVALPLTAEVTLEDLPRELRGIRPFDFEALAFGPMEPVDASDGTLDVELAPLEVAILELVLAPPPPSGASELADGLEPHRVVSLAADGRTVTLSYDPACGAVDHAVASGPLDGVAAQAHDRIACRLGVDGTATVDVGAGDRFWVVLGDGPESRGIAGRSSRGDVRPPPAAALGCFLEPATGTCP